MFSVSNLETNNEYCDNDNDDMAVMMLSMFLTDADSYRSEW